MNPPLIKIDVDGILELSDSKVMERNSVAAAKARALFAREKPIFVVEANIGFGKSSVTRVLSEYGVVPFHERTIEDPVFQLYYDNRSSFATGYQVHVGGLRKAQLWEAVRLKKRGLASCIDRSPYGEPLAFIPALNQFMSDIPDDQRVTLEKYFDIQFREGATAREEFMNYDKKKDGLPEDTIAAELARLSIIGTPPPDALILMHGERSVAWDRTLTRGRSEELESENETGGLPEPLHELLHAQYDAFYNNLSASGWFSGPVIYLEQPKVNLSRNTGRLILLESILEAFKKD